MLTKTVRLELDLEGRVGLRQRYKGKEQIPGKEKSMCQHV